MGVRRGFGKEAWIVSETFMVDEGRRLGKEGRVKKK